jgi:16S rRNA (cytidine1402-2'-O)-methyltransferase
MDIGTLFIVGTPIGNLKDITYRAVEVLKAAHVVACEDTRHTRVLLHHYDIKTKLIACHKFNEREATAEIKGLLDDGKNVALVTDAGMPAISDPGAVLINELRADGYKIASVPGATAVATAVSLAGVTENGFVFLGFLPEKLKDKTRLIENVKSVFVPLVFYCAPHDVDKTILYLHEQLGNRKAWAVKELTKIYETVYEGTLDNINIENKKGEFVLIVAPATGLEINDDVLKQKLNELVASGLTKSDAVKTLSKETGVNKNYIYELGIEI